MPLAPPSLPQPPPRTSAPKQIELDAITARGRLLAGYDIAAWHSSDAVQAEKLDPSTAGQYIAHKTAAGWSVDFGRLSPHKDNFLIAAEATQGATPETFTVKKFDPPKAVKTYTFHAARAIETARVDFQKQSRAARPYNIAVLPAPAGSFYVYLYPAQTQTDVYPLGGDVRYRVSPDGTKILERRQMHKSILDFPAPKPNANGVMPSAGYHTAVVDNIPEDTDVFFVLTRKPSLSEYIGTKKFNYLISPDGTIKNVGAAHNTAPLK